MVVSDKVQYTVNDKAFYFIVNRYTVFNGLPAGPFN